jgi:chromosome segregation ATPase
MGGRNRIGTMLGVMTESSKLKEQLSLAAEAFDQQSEKIAAMDDEIKHLRDMVEHQRERGEHYSQMERKLLRTIERVVDQNEDIIRRMHDDRDKPKLSLKEKLAATELAETVATALKQPTQAIDPTSQTFTRLRVSLEAFEDASRE